MRNGHPFFFVVVLPIGPAPLTSHRATGRRRGRREVRDDLLASQVDRGIREHGLDEGEAIRRVAAIRQACWGGAPPTARRRVLRAWKRVGDGKSPRGN